MKATGVVRRIDDLGRVVIPKEIRKTMKLKDGESVEIYLESNNIVLKKYSPMEGLPKFYKEYVDSIYSEIGSNIFIVDRDKVVAVSGDFKKKYLDKIISSNLDEIIQNRTIYCCEDYSEIRITEDIYEIASYVISPIISNGDAIGAVIILSTDKKIDDFMIKICSIASKFLGKYIE